MKVNVYLILLAFASLELFAADTQDAPYPISVEEAINTAVSNNLSMASLQYSLASREVNLQAARDRFKIDLRPELYTEQSDGDRTDAARVTASRDTVIGTTLSASAGTVRADIDSTNVLYRSSLTFQIKQPLLRRIGKQVNIEPVLDAHRGVRNARREIYLRQTDLIVEVVEAYENLLSLQRRIDYQTKTMERLRRFLKLTSAREKQGRSTRVDTMRADLRFGSAQLRMEALKDDLVTQRTGFAELLGYDPSTQFAAQPSAALVIDLPPAEDAITSALSNRLDYAQIIEDFIDAKRGAKIARKNLLPDLSLIARYEMFAEDESYSETTKLDEDVWFVGFQLASDFPLRNERSELATAELTTGISELRVESVSLAIRKQVRRAISAYKRVLAEKQLAEKNYQIARNRTRLARKLFEMGKGDSFSVSEAEDELLSAEEQLLSSQSSASVASYKLMRVTGSLIEYPEDLKPGELD